MIRRVSRTWKPNTNLLLECLTNLSCYIVVCVLLCFQDSMFAVPAGVACYCLLEETLERTRTTRQSTECMNLASAGYITPLYYSSFHFSSIIPI